MTDREFFALMLRTMFDTRKNKRYGKDSIEFERNWAPLLVRMTDELNTREFRIRHNYAFLTSIPKWREIFATEFAGRIADHLVCDILSPYIEMELHHRTFNNRKNMGSQSAINQVIEDIAEASNGYTEPAWVIKWDLKGFFPNADRDYMEQCFLRVIDKYAEPIAKQYGCKFPSFLKWLASITIHCNPTAHCELRTPPSMWEHIKPEKSLFSKPEGLGVPIGRMISQTGMGLYINDDVRWLNDNCGIHTTVFMDDGVMVVPERLKPYALSLLPVLRQRLAEKGVRLNDRKFYCQPYWRGLEFLGSHIKPYDIILNDNSWRRCVRRVQEFNALPSDGKFESIDQFISTVNSYTGLLKNRTSFRRIEALRTVIDDDWWQWLTWDEQRQCICSKPQYSLRARLKRKYHLKIKAI